MDSENILDELLGERILSARMERSDRLTFVFDSGLKFVIEAGNLYQYEIEPVLDLYLTRLGRR